MRRIAVSLSLIIPIALLLLVTDGARPEAYADSSLTLSRVADLTGAPDGQRLGLLLPGTPVQILETRGGWARVSVQGWILMEGDEAAEARPAQASPGDVPVAMNSAGLTLSGAISINDTKGRRHPGAGASVRLVSDANAGVASLLSERAECASRLAEMQREVDGLTQKMNKALRIERGSAAFQAYDDAKRERNAKAREIDATDNECHGRIEASVEAHTVARTLSDGEGRYSLDRLSPGSYLLYVVLTEEDGRDEWALQVELKPGEAKNLDPTPDNLAAHVSLPN